MNIIQRNFRFTIVIVSALVLTIWAVFALSTEPKEPTNPNKQTLPTLYISSDDVQYFPPSPGFKLAREAAAIRQAAEEEASQQKTDGEAVPLIVTPPIIQEEEEEKPCIPPP